MGLESGAPSPKVMGALGHIIEGKGVVRWVWEITSYHKVAKTIWELLPLTKLPG